jgi:hypothetical protein
MGAGADGQPRQQARAQPRKRPGAEAAGARHGALESPKILPWKPRRKTGAFKMIKPEIKEFIDRYKKLHKENKRLQAEYGHHVADLKRLFREFRSHLPKKSKSN